MEVYELSGSENIAPGDKVTADRLHPSLVEPNSQWVGMTVHQLRDAIGRDRRVYRLVEGPQVPCEQSVINTAQRLSKQIEAKEHDSFALMIGRLDRLLSELILTAACPVGTDEANRQTLKHHAEDMIGAGQKILELIGYPVEPKPQEKAHDGLSILGEVAIEWESHSLQGKVVSTLANAMVVSVKPMAKRAGMPLIKIRCDEHELLPESTINSMEKMRKAFAILSQFKTYVHSRLSAIGVPADPDPETTQRTGCRISGRLTWLISKTNELEQEVTRLRKRLRRHEPMNDPGGWGTCHNSGTHQPDC